MSPDAADAPVPAMARRSARRLACSSARVSGWRVKEWGEGIVWCPDARDSGLVAADNVISKRCEGRWADRGRRQAEG